MIDIHDVQSGYQQVCLTVLAKGEEVSPRGKKTRELLGTTVRVHDVTRSLPLHIGRGCNPAIGAVEACQLIGGFSDPDLTCRIAPNMKEFLTVPADPFRDAVKPFFHGAYGPRIRSQVEAALQVLRKDPDSRQAVLTIWDPKLDLLSRQPDLPCTVSLHLLLRGGKLVLHTHMRSNDVWWGFAYDVFQFTQLQLTLANMLEVESGLYYHHTTSLHLYQRDWDRVDDLEVIPNEIMPSLWGFLDVDRAWKIGHGLDVDSPSETERWYQAQLGRYLDVGSGDDRAEE